MNPKPFCTLKNFTVPVAIIGLLALNTGHEPRALRGARTSEFWEMTCERSPKNSSVARQTETSLLRTLQFGMRGVKMPDYVARDADAPHGISTAAGNFGARGA